LKGCRAFTRDEIRQLADLLAQGKYGPRNRCWFLLGCYTGRRISQLLSLTVGDVHASNGRVTDRIWWARCTTKGRQEGQAVALGKGARACLKTYMRHVRAGKELADLRPLPLFASRQQAAPLTQRQVYLELVRQHRADLTGDERKELRAQLKSMRRQGWSVEQRLEHFCRQEHLARFRDRIIAQARTGIVPLSAVRASVILHGAARALGLRGKTGTHSMRKTYAQAVHKAFRGNIIKTQAALGHREVTSTQRYLDFAQDEIDRVVRAIEF